MAVATAQVGMARERPTDRRSAPSAGQTATHSRHPVHSADLTVVSRSTGSSDGQAFAHLAQSMHASASRRMRAGLNSETRPTRAPYGQRYRHHRFFTNTEPTSSTRDHDRAGRPDAAEEVQHLHVRHQAVRAGDEPVEVGHGHRRRRRSRRTRAGGTSGRAAGCRASAAPGSCGRTISRPPSQSHSDSVPIGHSQLQKAFRATKRDRRRTPPGGTSRPDARRARCPSSSVYFRFIRPAMGSQPSTPGGRLTKAVCPPVS